MASGERRLGSGRRGMTVLGKIPTPSVPKPINLPSQRLENQGFEPSVELVPRGTFSWGSAARSNAVGVSKEGGSGVAASPPTISVAWNGALKIQDLSASSNGAGSLAESNRPSSTGSATRPSSAPTSATNGVWSSSAKTKVDMQVQSSGFTVNAVEPVILGSQKSAELTPQQKNVILNRPTSADGTVVDRDMRRPHPGVNAPSPVPGPEGFQHPGDGYNGHRPFVWQGTPPAGGHELPVGPGSYSSPLPHGVYYSPFGVSQYGNAKDRGMVVRMVNGSGVYGSYPPHLRPAEGFDPPGLYGSYRPTPMHNEQFSMSGNSTMGASSCAPGTSIGFFSDGNNCLSLEGDGKFGTVPRDGGYPGLQRDIDSSRNIPIYGSDRNRRMPRTFGRHNYASGEHGNYVKEGVASFAMPVPEKKITLLTKMPRVEAPSTETTSKNSTLLDSNEGSEGCQQKTEMSKIEARDKNESAVFEVKGVKKANKFLGSKKLDGDVVKMSTRAVSEIKQDAVAVNCSKDNLTEIEAGVTEHCPPRSPQTWRKAAGRHEVNGLSSTRKLLTSTTNENTQDSELKAQMNHYLKSEVDSDGRKISHEGAHSGVISESVGFGSKAVGREPTKLIVVEDVSYRDDPKAKSKALNHKNEKEWRPKSPVVESKAPGLRVGKGGKQSEELRNAESVKEVSSQECSTGSVVLEASSQSRTQKADKRRLFRNVGSLSPSASSGINPNKEASFLLIEDSNCAQSRVVEVAVDQPSQSKNEASSKGVHNIATSAVEVLHADAFKVVAIEGLTLKGDHKAKPRQSNHKGEKEWRPKSPAVDSTAASDNISGSQASEANATSTSVSDIDVKSILDLKILEQEGLQPFDTYDYEGQRAKLKEIAAQRAKQREKEEEERVKEQKAKAFAKLEELNRRTLANPTSAKMVEHGFAVCMDEVPNKKTKTTLDLSRRSSVDAPAHDSGALEKQHIDEDMVWAPVKNSPPISATTAFHKKHATEVGEVSKESPRNEVILSQNSRSKSDEPDRNSLKTAEKRQPHKSLTATSSYQEQRQQSSRERLIHDTEEDLPSVYDTEVESSSSKFFGVEIRKDDAPKSGRLHGGRRQTDSTQNQNDKVALTYRNERKGTVEEHQELEQPKPSSAVSQTGESRDKGGFLGRVASRRQQQSSVEVQKQSKAGEPSVFMEEHPFAVGHPQRNVSFNADARQQSAGNRRLGQKHKSEMEACFTIEQVKSFGMKQPKESTVSSDASFGSEKSGHVSWRQKGSNHLPHSDKPISGLKKDMESALEKGLDTPNQSQKSHKVKNAGKESMACRPQRGPIQVEVRELCVVEEKRTAVSGSTSELTALNADKHEVEAKASESVKAGRPHNPRRQKNITNGSYLIKQASKEYNERHPESLAATEEAFEEIDPTYLPATSSSKSHNLIANTKQSPRAAIGAPPWHRHRSMKLSNATLSPGQAASQVPLEEHTPIQVVPVSWHGSRSNVASTQGWETEQLQESESLTADHSRKHGSQLHAEPTLLLETTAQNHKHQQLYSAKIAETIPNQHVPAFSSKTRSNNTHAENHKMSRQHQTGPKAFRSREQHHEAESEIGNNRGEQRPSRGRDKPSRKNQFNGCSTVAELDRRGAEPAIKTAISY